MLNQSIKTINLKYQHLLGMKHLTCLMDCIIYQKYKTILNIQLKNMKQLVKMHQYSI